MSSKVVLIHGWSTDSGSMRKVGSFLQSHGYTVQDVWLSDYISLADDIRVGDVARQMQDVMSGLTGQLGPSFDVIVHSTGGLVFRDWLTRYYPDGTHAGIACPVKHAVMLAPANFGSRLAAAGKSFVGRVIKGWDTWFQTGTQMLNSLELASDYQWQLAQRDLVRPGGGVSPYGPDKVMPFVIVGSRGHSEGLEQIADELGSDGVVRPSAASLKAVGMSLRFRDDVNPPAVENWDALSGSLGIPLAVLPNRNHGTITDPATTFGTFGPQVGDLIMQALRCSPTLQAYADIDQAWREISGRTHDLTDMASSDAAHPPNPVSLHRYLQVVVHAIDDQGRDVCDYFVEFYDPGALNDEQDSVILHTKVIRDTHIYSQNQSYRCFFIDRSALLSDYYGSGKYTQVAMSLSAAKPGDHVAYFNSKTATAAGHVVISTRAGATATTDTAKNQLGEFLREDRTHLIQIIIPREPVPGVFKMPPPGPAH